MPDSRQWGTGADRPQLRMLFPPTAPLPAITVPDGYLLRPLVQEDRASYLALMAKAGFGAWDATRFTWATAHDLPGGYFGIEHQATGTLGKASARRCVPRCCAVSATPAIRRSTCRPTIAACPRSRSM